jgi:hypothetical protein
VARICAQTTELKGGKQYIKRLLIINKYQKLSYARARLIFLEEQLFAELPGALVKLQCLCFKQMTVKPMTTNQKLYKKCRHGFYL